MSSTKQPSRLVGALLLLGYAFGAYLCYFASSLFGDGGFFISAVLLFPLLIGLATQTLTDPDQSHTASKNWQRSLIVTAILAVALFIFHIETVICIAMAVPIFLPMQYVGVLLARASLKRTHDWLNRDILRASTLVLPLALPLAGIDITFPETNAQVVSEIVIDASPSVVWANTEEIAEIQDEERISTLSHRFLRAPRPLDAVVTGSVRQLRWTKGVRFQEHITKREENRFLEWKFVFNDKQTLSAFDPHVSPDSRELKLTGGSYRLKELPDGKTRLHLATNYTLRTPFNPYLKLWGSLFLNDFHNSVLHVIKTRSETST
ncbi:hypothetical protein KO498_04715 [Lentibacter algarum]|uniref:hypothetical protein n=1 Tax=Lentibacter algarum TaxID=576131 RepID=UPI001C065BEF|nr:hypothetical protein [Lentibacter algarum]MBU2981111.1 hypothetical protein [Lentibacter algarum]